MNRRDFIKQASLASTAMFLPKFVSGFNLIDSAVATGKKLVIIQLSGGNDGLNTVVPFRNDIYFQKRPSLAQQKSSLIGITDDIGFHESLVAHSDLYHNGELCVVNNVGYPNPNRSHFRATDIWHTASSANEYLQSGWVGRYLDATKSNSTAAIEVDDTLSLLLKGEQTDGIATKNPQLFFRTTQEPYFKKVVQHHDDSHLSEHNLGYLYKTMVTASNSAKYLYETSKTYTSKIEYPKNEFAKQLKQVAQFINSGLQTKVYYTSLGGFDTHANQINKQKRLLSVYDEAMAAFIKDLKQQDSFKDTLIMTFSEFGRRVQQNAANGTDHGTANQVFLIGKQLKKQGFYNPMPNLSNLDENGDIQFDVDFRKIYASILNNWLDVDATKVMRSSFTDIKIV
ncbi:uncharacterized protein (DUF1501 family) [Kordia periserrulae]|uniref:Uncharacterized protein (DUF1501 family) n=1 Tax=Kordia periserrulae TaxID=701523 RepID=A0A2T6C533_9FLAO|nr:DUF1501 domain-containing protein [Kordia periserrulae]PTX63434.1 uncharacterized protein (DUF1501 family) [Kordia periserrulae]